MAEKTISHAIFEWFEDGVRRWAYRGEVVDIPESVVAQYDRFGVFASGDDVPAPLVESITTPDPFIADAVMVADPTDISTGPKGPVPPKAGLKELWVEYAVENGMTESDAEAMSKHELIAKFGTGSD